MFPSLDNLWCVQTDDLKFHAYETLGLFCLELDENYGQHYCVLLMYSVVPRGASKGGGLCPQMFERYDVQLLLLYQVVV